jgi:hypothetical protein
MSRAGLEKHLAAEKRSFDSLLAAIALVMEDSA